MRGLRREIEFTVFYFKYLINIYLVMAVLQKFPFY